MDCPPTSAAGCRVPGVFSGLRGASGGYDSVSVAEARHLQHPRVPKLLTVPQKPCADSVVRGRRYGLRSAVLSIAVFAAATLQLQEQPAAAVMFDLAPHARDCFFVKTSNADSELAGSYQAFFGDGSVRVTVEGPVLAHRSAAQPPVLKEPIYTSVEETAHISATLPTKGEYAVCVRNLLSFEQTITIDFHLLTSKRGVHPNQLALEDEALKLKTLTADVLEKATSLFEQQSHSMVRMGVHAELGQSTRRRATLWKCIQMGLQLILSGVHIYSVKSYFEVKTIV